jgi:two-component system, sensor histidine kinase and response regulator
MPKEVNILAVDDVEENLIALSTLLRRPGLRLLEARSGNEALEALLSNDIALALLDVNMPGMDGFELAELMRGSERTRHVPIIFLTAAVPERGRLFQGYEAGAVDFLYKPLDPHLLASKVEVFAQLHRQKQQLAAQVQQIQQAQAMSDLFIGVLGHDLRNPLNSIVSSAELLEEDPGDAANTLRKVRIIQRASGRMARLIQSVLDFALARVKGGIPVALAEVDLAAVVRQATNELGPAVAERVHVELQGITKGNWDADRMMQVVSNLASNAVEYGDPATPIHITVDGNAPETVRLRFHNGGAIPRATLDSLFSAFKPRSQHSRGLGIGLYIVDQIIRAHRGEITVTSDESSGTTFTVHLPRHLRG